MINKKEKIIQGWESPIAIHPGEFLRDELEEYNITQIELAERIGLHKKIINEIIAGKNSITRLTAVKLEKVFDTSAQYWVNLQGIYENDKVRLEEAKKIEKEIKAFIKIPALKEMYYDIVALELVKKYRWIKKNYSEIIFVLQKFFGVDSLKYVGERTFEPIFRKYDRERVNRYSISAWLRISEIKAKKVSVEKFNIQGLKKVLLEMKQLSVELPEEYLPKIEKILADVGVVLVCAPYLKNTYVQGATYWINKDKVCVVIKTTKQGEDKFWFNLFHELGHIILKHNKKEIFIDIENGEKNKQEKEADEFAQKNLILNYNLRVVKYSNYKKAIELISKEDKISPSIVAGRIAHEYRDKKEAWKLTSRYIKSINYTNI